MARTNLQKPLSRSVIVALLVAGSALVCGVPAFAATQTEVVKANSAETTTGPGVPAGIDVTITNQMLAGAGSDNTNWLAHGHSYENQRFSALDQVNAGNVDHLVPVAIVQTGITGTSFETTPVVANGVMYATTGVVNGKMKIMALNAATGEAYWQTTFTVGANQVCCGSDNRGVAVAYGNVYFVTLDDKLVSLDARTGKVKWETTIADADPRAGYSETMAPQVYDNEIIIGSAGGEWPIRGFVAAYTADSGKQLWRWQATDPKSFEGDSWKHGGGMNWTTPAVDPKLGLVIFSTGNPNPDLFGGARTGDDLYTDSIVALDAKTGKRAWYYQEVKHDVWDYDAVSNVVLFDVDENGKTIPAAGEAGKVGWFFIVNRKTGKLIRKSQPYVMMNKNMFKAPSKAGVDILPGANGGSEWSPPAFSPKTHDVYIVAMNQLMDYTTEGHSAATYIPGQMRLGSVFKNVEQGAVQNGVLTAVNVDTGDVAWKYHAPQPLIGGALATAGDLVFTGEGNGNFDAINATTGTRLWHFNLGAGVNAPPITYEVDGTQYIAVAAGGNFQLSYPYGDVLAIFKLAK
ncbi:MAG: pyrroloquinoline quinone-dependent dehydrogenase [Rhodanobacteraceae bacterium]